MKIQKNAIGGLQVKNVHTDVFKAILKDLNSNLPDSRGSWVLPFTQGHAIRDDDDGEGFLVLFPKFIDNTKTRQMIEKALGIKLKKYKVITIWDER
ncbi:MAG TPA: hypothetical protein VL335_01815 [Candidatus Paceibacterota bacterium]|jgi:hypothetical protein|nr:hypothetical protein [Candidatus Paceibacterota bacterium]